MRLWLMVVIKAVPFARALVVTASRMPQAERCASPQLAIEGELSRPAFHINPVTY